MCGGGVRGELLSSKAIRSTSLEAQQAPLLSGSPLFLQLLPCPGPVLKAWPAAFERGGKVWCGNLCLALPPGKYKSPQL